MRLLMILCLMVTTLQGCQPGASAPDGEATLLVDVTGYTFHGDTLVRFDAMAMGGGKVLAVGDSEEISGRYPGAEVVRGGGGVVLPGLIDAHGHVMRLGFRELDLNVAGIGSLQETLEAVSRYSESHPGPAWIRGRGWNQVLWEENRFPSAADLDRVESERPVWLVRVDEHAGWANSRAMELAGVDRGTPDPGVGQIHRDENGDPTGIFTGDAKDLITDAIPERSPAEKESALRLADELMASNGLTSVHDAGTGEEEWALFRERAERGELRTRIYAMIRGVGGEFDRLSAVGPLSGIAGDKLALRSVKLVSDGALGSRGAALLEEYSDDPGNRGYLYFSQEELNEQVLRGASLGYQMVVHAIGDEGNRQVLNAFEHVRNELGDDGLRHRVEHAQIVELTDIPRFRELGLVASMQPTHATSDMNMAEDRVGPERIAGGYAWRMFLEQGTVIASGSDFPVEEVNPFHGLYAAVTRQDAGGNPPGGWYPEHLMSREEALRSFTLDAAWAAHQEEMIGSLEPGKWADFILVDRDYFEVPLPEIREIRVLETWVAGERVWNHRDEP